MNNITNPASPLNPMNPISPIYIGRTTTSGTVVENTPELTPLQENILTGTMALILIIILIYLFKGDKLP